MKSFGILFRALLVPALLASLIASRASADEQLLTTKKDFKPAALSPKQPQIEVNFPGAARKDGLMKGSAFVCVLVDAEGKPKDILAVQYSARAFGDALAEKAKDIAYQPASYQGVNVPARYNLAYNFETGVGSLTPDQEVKRMIADKTTLNDKNDYHPLQESDLDQPLEPIELAVPRVPAGYTAPDNKPVEVVLTFFVDETGHVRVPNVEIADSPKLIRSAVNAILQSTFHPPMAKGKPVLVLAQRTVKFVPRTPKPAAPSANGK